MVPRVVDDKNDVVEPIQLNADRSKFVNIIELIEIYLRDSDTKYNTFFCFILEIMVFDCVW